MDLNWSNGVIKNVLLVFNVFFVISGIILMAVGVSVKSYYTDYDFFLNSYYFSLPNLLIATGSLIFFISFFGCYGAIKESWFMIFIFTILLSIIFILELSAGIAGFVLRDTTPSYLEEILSKSMKDYKFNEKADETTRVWDSIQHEFKCCGARGPFDWHLSDPITEASTTTVLRNTGTTPLVNLTGSSALTNTTETLSTKFVSTTKDRITVSGLQASKSKKDDDDLPVSCCKPVPGATGTTTCSLKSNSTMTHFDVGCLEGFGDYLKSYAVTLGRVGITVAVIQLFGVIFVCLLARRLKYSFHST